MNENEDRAFQDGTDPEERDRKHALLKKSARKIYSLCAVSFAAAVVIVSLAKTGVSRYLFSDLFIEAAGMKTVVSVLVNYAVFLPVTGLLLGNLPAQRVRKRNMKLPDLLSFLAMTFPVAFIGDLVGNAISALAAGETSRNPVSDAVAQGNIVFALITVIVAPVIEELVFRKWLLDRIFPLGGGAAVIFSALCFALFHTNFVQLFYAFGMGLIFGYVYLRSGNIVNAVVLHSAVNLFGGVLAPFAFSLPDWEALSALLRMISDGADIPESMVNAVLPGLMGFLGYAAVFALLIAAGIISFIHKIGELRLPERGDGLTAGESASAIFLNAGMFIFIAAALFFSIRDLL